MAPRFSTRARVSLAALLAFVLALAAAASVYPGGSWLRPRASGGFSLENFWCDLLREPAYNGVANGRAVALATLAFAALGLALGPFWLEVSRLLAPGRARFVRIAGVSSAIATATVAFLPSDRFPLLHAPAVLTAGGLGFACGCLCSAWALARPRQVPVFFASSLLLVTTAAVNLGLYVYEAYFEGPSTVVLPAVQKVATLALVVWIASGLRAGAGRVR